VYPLSVVAGGVYTAGEVEVARQADPVIAAHYEGINVPALRRVVLDNTVLRYVSFRRGNQVYWTRQAMPVPAGEAVLADADSMLRARCGNRLSAEPREPVLPAAEPQPTAADFEVPLPPDVAPPVLVTSVAPGMRSLYESKRDALGNPCPQSRGRSLAESPDSGLNSADLCLEPPPGSVAAGDVPVGSPLSTGGTSGGTTVASSGAVPGFAGFNVLGGSLGGGVPAPNTNPALSGPGGVAPLDPDLFLPSPPQITPHLPQQDPLPVTAPDGVFAVLTPVAGGGSPTTYSIGLPNTQQFGSTQLPLGLVGEGPFGSRPVGGVEQTPSVGAGSAVSSVGLTLLPGLPPGAILPGTPQNPGPMFYTGGGVGTGGGGSGTDGGSTPVDGAVPEPWTIVLVGSGLAAIRQRSRRRDG
jgi:hypothetical protein